MPQKTRIERAQARLLRHALNFCDADNEVQQARMWWRKLNESHDPFDVICITKFKDRSMLCKLCIDFQDNSPNYMDALHRRRTAKSNMKRAFKKLVYESSKSD